MSAGPLIIRHGAYLPHWTKEGGTYAVTFRLADSLPESVLREIRAERARTIERAESMGRPMSQGELNRLEELCSERVEAFLDAGHGECHLRDPRIASLVRGALSFFDAERYVIHAWTVMPNHVHAVFTPVVSLPSIMKSWKGFTSKEANKVLGRRGQFWQHESYDRLIRGEAEFVRQSRYVLQNPESAGLLAWPWVGATPEVLRMLREEDEQTRLRCARDILRSSTPGTPPEESGSQSIRHEPGGSCHHVSQTCARTESERSTTSPAR